MGSVLEITGLKMLESTNSPWVLTEAKLRPDTLLFTSSKTEPGKSPTTTPPSCLRELMLQHPSLKTKLRDSSACGTTPWPLLTLPKLPTAILRTLFFSPLFLISHVPTLPLLRTTLTLSC